MTPAYDAICLPEAPAATAWISQHYDMKGRHRPPAVAYLQAKTSNLIEFLIELEACLAIGNIAVGLFDFLKI